MKEPSLLRTEPLVLRVESFHERSDSMKMKNVRALAAILVAALLALASCSTIPSHSTDAPATWLEGKALDLTVNFQEGSQLDKVIRVTLAYTLNDGEERLLDMERVLGKASVTIPGSELKPGLLSWRLLVDNGKKVQKTKAKTLRVISRAEGLELARRELAAAVDWDPLLTPPDFLDAEFPLGISRATPQASVRFFVRKKGLGWELRPGFLQDGATTLVLRKEELASGYDSLYVEVQDEHPDFGVVTASFPPGGASAPHAISPLTEAQTRAMLSRELAASLSHKAEKEGSVYYDISLDFSYKPSGSLIRSLAQGDPALSLSALLPGAATWSRIDVAMPKAASWTARIPASALRGGTLSYALDLAIDVRGLGLFSAAYPEAGRDKPFSLSILDAPASRARLETELRKAFSIELPKTSSVLEDQEIRAKIALDPGSWLARRAKPDSEAIFARLRRGGALELRQRGFNKDFRGWYLALSASDLASGVDGFAVDLSIDSGTAAGKLTVTLPEGWNAAYQLNVLTKQQLVAKKMEEYQSTLSSRFNPPRSLSAARSATLVLPFDQDCSRAVISYYRTGAKAMATLNLARSSSGWQVTLPAEDMVAGNLVYWFSFEVQDKLLGALAFNYPPQGEAAPLRATVVAAP